jgi:hypothetical protein
MFSSWNDRPTRKLANADPETEKLAAAAAVGRNVPPVRTPGPSDEMPPEYWLAVLDAAATDHGSPGPSIRMERLADIQHHVLRVACRRCGRTVEIQKVDAIRLAGSQAVWKDVGQRLLDDTCQVRTGRHEEDGCWPIFE